MRSVPVAAPMALCWVVAYAVTTRVHAFVPAVTKRTTSWSPLTIRQAPLSPASLVPTISRLTWFRMSQDGSDKISSSDDSDSDQETVLELLRTDLADAVTDVVDDAVASIETTDDTNTEDSSTDNSSTAESAAMQWAREQVAPDEEDDIGISKSISKASATLSPVSPKHFVVVGAGWGGWGAAKALCESSSNVEVTILDALPDPTGRTPYLSASGKPVEAGTRGFWKDYPNINTLCTETLGLKEDDVFTDFTNSSFYSPDGLEATAPVFSGATFPDLPFLPKSLVGQALPELPSPVGQVLATFPLFERLPLPDRASMVGLLVATVDCLGNTDPSVQGAYDRMTAHELFVRFGLSKRMVDDFIRPTLLVGLFKPPEELSALVVMELLYYYALAHMDSFDVRWIKNGTVADSLTAPLASKLEDEHDLNIIGGARVNTIATTPNIENAKVHSVQYSDSSGTSHTIEDVDGVVLALSNKGMKAVVGGSPDLARYPVFSQAASCQGIDVISVRLWLDTTVPTRTPANVFSRFPELRGAGGTFFMLDQFQPDQQQLWGNDEPQGSVVACDFYNAGALLSLDDATLVDILMKDLLPAAVPMFANAQAVDTWVGRYPGAVSWFAPGTLQKRPPLENSHVSNLKCAGDWVRMGDREHGAKGLCQERAYVSGLEAGNALLRECGDSALSPHTVLPVREDESQFRAAVEVNRKVMSVVPRFWVR